MKKLYMILFAACCAALLGGCSKDDKSAFAGSDNYITSFRLVLGEGSLGAAVSGDKITVNTVENRVLNGAKANVAISENAKIYPNPASIVDWDNEHTFVVTSYGGQQRIYHYSAVKEKAESVKKGNFTLSTQMEVNDFGLLGVETLDGYLKLGLEWGKLPTDPDDPITSLAPLASLKEVKGVITLNCITPINPAGPKDLTGLENLVEAGAILIPGTNGSHTIKVFAFPNLEVVHGDLKMDFPISGRVITTVYLPKLTRVEGDFWMEGMGGISSYIVPKLKTVLGILFVGGNGGTDQLTSLSFPSLELIGGALKFYQFTGSKLELPLLKSCGGFEWEQLNRLEKIECPALETLMGVSTLKNTSNQPLIIFSLPKVTYIEDLTLDGYTSLASLELPVLRRVKNLKLVNLPIKDLNSLQSLETVDGTLTLQNLSQLQTFELPSSLRNLNTLAVSNLPGMTALDLRGSGIKGVSIASTVPFQLSVDDVLEGSLTLSGIIELTGCRQIRGNVSITRPSSTEAIVQLPSTEEIGGSFIFSYSGKKGSVSFPALREVGGAFTVKSDSPFAAAQLKSIGGALLYDIGMASLSASIVAEFALPRLESVGGNFTVYTWARPTIVPFEIKMPSLTAIDGILTIRHTDPSSLYGSTTLPSNNLSNLDGFSALTSLKGVNIWRQGALRSYEGLRSAFRSFEADSWEVLNNIYNPSYQDMLDGNYIME